MTRKKVRPTLAQTLDPTGLSSRRQVLVEALARNLVTNNLPKEMASECLRCLTVKQKIWKKNRVIERVPQSSVGIECLTRVSDASVGKVSEKGCNKMKTLVGYPQGVTISDKTYTYTRRWENKPMLPADGYLAFDTETSVVDLTQQIPRLAPVYKLSSLPDPSAQRGRASSVLNSWFSRRFGPTSPGPPEFVGELHLYDLPKQAATPS